MQATDIISHKRMGGSHDQGALETLIGGYVRGEIPDYQVAAWLMAVCWRGMTPKETALLTEVMAHSGEVLDLSDLPHTVDKHSTGGVGDKTTLVLAPLLAACGATVAKMSGRGLGHTGGTIDKLESIPGFRTELSESAFMRQAREVGVVVTGQSKELAPADGLLYALRDATATVASLPLIASSIMSKKLAGGAQSLVLDVKVGSGAFMKTLSDARALAETMQDIGRRAGRTVRVVLSSMAEPLGNAVGNVLEVQEAMRCLKGEGPSDVQRLCTLLAVQVLEAVGLGRSEAQISETLASGAAYERFERWVAEQGGEVERLGALELAPDQHLVRTPRDGYVAQLEALSIGQAVGVLGGGRSKKGDAVDLGVGVVLHAKVGDEVGEGEAVATLYHRGGRGLTEAVALLEGSLRLGDAPPDVPPLVLETLT